MNLKRLLAGVLTVLVILSTTAKADPIGYIGPNAVSHLGGPITAE